jgi:hypothetical protein
MVRACGRNDQAKDDHQARPDETVPPGLSRYENCAELCLEKRRENPPLDLERLGANAAVETRAHV